MQWLTHKPGRVPARTPLKQPADTRMTHSDLSDPLILHISRAAERWNKARVPSGACLRHVSSRTSLSLWFKQCSPKAAKHAWEETLGLFLSHIFFQFFVVGDGFGAHRAQLTTTVEHDEVVEGHVEKAIILILHLQGFKLVPQTKPKERQRTERGMGQQTILPSFPVNKANQKINPTFNLFLSSGFFSQQSGSFPLL